ncbi:hypothetical protein H6P81_018535 [Aristolochia fimbriata]|uniref:Thymidylate kinase n=1 Tax=Aristolochia fimbriata TaxID=158543 RepID=A0AAV7E4J6_ARIFI|nr:hypothetical protein H6P81_018535 [Aristolochia fimbriata]
MKEHLRSKENESVECVERDSRDQRQLNLHVCHNCVQFSYILLLKAKEVLDMQNTVALTFGNAFNIGALGTSRSLKVLLRISHKVTNRHIHMENGQKSDSRGALIVLEGLDRSGKTSQSAKLASFLAGKGFSVESWRFPERKTCVGEMISLYLSNKSQLDDQTIHLLFSANRWEKRFLMETKLRSGVTLIVDRYSYSGVAFSAAKGLDIQWCKAPETGLLAPDLVLYLDIPPEKAAERGDYGVERYEQLDFQRKVAHHYEILRDETWKIVDGCLPMEAVEKQLREFTLECVAKCRRGEPLSQLWL